MDLMFSDPRDPPAVKAAREFERAHMRKWIEEVAHRQKGTGVRGESGLSRGQGASA